MGVHKDTWPKFVPQRSHLKVEDVSLEQDWRPFSLPLPFLRRVTPKAECDEALMLAQRGYAPIVTDGSGLLAQIRCIQRLKRSLSVLDKNPPCIQAESLAVEAYDLLHSYGYSYLVVVEGDKRICRGVIRRDKLSEDVDTHALVLQFTDRSLLIEVSEVPSTTEALQSACEETKDQPLSVLISEKGELLGVVNHARLFAEDALVREVKQIPVGAEIHLDQQKNARHAMQAIIEAGADVIILVSESAYDRRITEAITWMRRQDRLRGKLGGGHVITSEAAYSLIEAGSELVVLGVSRRMQRIGYGAEADLYIGEKSFLEDIRGENRLVVTDIDLHDEEFTAFDALHMLAGGVQAFITSHPVDQLDAMVEDLRYAMTLSNSRNVKEFRKMAKREI